MNGDVEYLFREIYRHLTLARQKNQTEAERYLDKAVWNVDELKRQMEKISKK